MAKTTLALGPASTPDGANAADPTVIAEKIKSSNSILGPSQGYMAAGSGAIGGIVLGSALNNLARVV
jgi:hypothetical protein